MIADVGMSTKSDEKQRRISSRVPIKLQVDYKSEGHFLFENATNISEHGVFVHTNKPLDPGTIVELQFTLPDSKEKLKIRGEVMWVNPYRKEQEKNYNPGMGVRFESLNELDKEILLSAIKRIAVL
jgi:uncharacterized protein (TIGR02266 family)